MATEQDDVLLRLERLEGRVGLAPRQLQASQLTADEIAVYHKVEALLWEDGCCGINETSPCVFKCTILKEERLQPVLDRECLAECAPGLPGLPDVFERIRGGFRRFSRLGG